MVSHKLDFFTALKEPPSSLLQDNGKALLFLGPYALLLVVIQFSKIAYNTARRRASHTFYPIRHATVKNFLHQ